jgi:hypothetical protein
MKSNIGKYKQGIVELWNTGKYSMAQIGEKCDISKQRVSQILSYAKEKGDKIISASDKGDILKSLYSQYRQNYKFIKPVEEHSKNYRCINFNQGQWGIYFVKCGRYIKIGQTNNIDTRIKEIRRNNPFKLEILLLLDHIDEFSISEKAFHSHFDQYKFQGEWYYYQNELKYFVNMPFNRLVEAIKSILIKYLI